MRIFVAGATGVLGRRVVQALVGRGHKVTGLARRPENEPMIHSMGAACVRADIFDLDAMIRAVAGHEAVLHLATSIPKKNRPSRNDWAINDLLRTKGVDHLVQASLANNVNVYVQQSIVHLYGNRKGGEVDEQTPLGTDVPYSLRSALAMERMIRESIEARRLPAIILRFGGFYGVDAHNSRSMIEGIRKGKIPIVGKGDAVRNLIHLDDAAAAVVQAVERYEGNTGRVFNIVDDKPVTMRELFETIAGMTASPAPRSVPVWLARIVAGKDALDFLAISVKVSNKAAKAGLQWSPRYPNVRAGLHQVLAGDGASSSLLNSGKQQVAG
jgi:nucleoside-diphosphate-sugar epimerase